MPPINPLFKQTNLKTGISAKPTHKNYTESCLQVVTYMY